MHDFHNLIVWKKPHRLEKSSSSGKKLIVWKKAHQINLAIFRLTESQTSDTSFLFTQM